MKKVAWLAAVLLGSTWPALAFATTLTTTHYQLDSNVAGAFGGSGGSTHYGPVYVAADSSLQLTFFASIALILLAIYPIFRLSRFIERQLK